MDGEEKQPEMKKDGQKVKEATRKDEKVTARWEKRLKDPRGDMRENEVKRWRERRWRTRVRREVGGDDGQRGKRKRCNMMK